MNELVCRKEKTLSQAHQVLSRVFSQAAVESRAMGKNAGQGVEEEKFFFFTSDLAIAGGTSASLIFSFNNGVDRDPQFANEVLARLYVDEKKCLCLAIWPLNDAKRGLSSAVMRKEILLENVQSSKFTFYQPPEEEKLTVQTSKIQTGEPQIQPSPGKHSEWLKDYGQLPRTMNLLITLKGDEKAELEPVVFSYLLPTLNPAIKVRGL